MSEWAEQLPKWGTEDYRRYAALFNDITYAPTEQFIHFGTRNVLADYLWQQGWRREMRDEDESKHWGSSSEEAVAGAEAPVRASSLEGFKAWGVSAAEAMAGAAAGAEQIRDAFSEGLRKSEPLTLSEFLLARIAEDERQPPWDETAAVARHPRVLAECEAKRRIVEACALTASPVIDGDARVIAGLALDALALPYADHPDYRQEWKP